MSFLTFVAWAKTLFTICIVFHRKMKDEYDSEFLGELYLWLSNMLMIWHHISCEALVHFSLGTQFIFHASYFNTKSISNQSGCCLRRKQPIWTVDRLGAELRKRWRQTGEPAQHWTQILDDCFSSTALCWYVGMSQTLKSLSFSLWVFIRTDERHALF